MTNREKYHRAFSALHTSDGFKVELEEKKMKQKFRLRHALTAACVVLAAAAGGTTVYAANIGGIQRTIQIWLHGDQTDAVLTVDEDGTYTISDENMERIQGGGGVALGEDGSERPLTADEIYEDLANEVTTDTIDGRMYLLYKDQKKDITDEFTDKDVFYATLKGGDQVLYVTVMKDGSLAHSKDRYLLPGTDF